MAKREFSNRLLSFEIQNDRRVKKRSGNFSGQFVQIDSILGGIQRAYRESGRGFGPQKGISQFEVAVTVFDF